MGGNDISSIIDTTFDVLQTIDYAADFAEIAFSMFMLEKQPTPLEAVKIQHDRRKHWKGWSKT